jgi:hypothetical protein
VKSGAADCGRLTHLKGIKGVLYITTKLRETKTYAVKNCNPQGCTVLIGHPVRDQFQLAGITMLAQTAGNAYPFKAQVAVRKTATQVATEERDLTCTALLTDSPDEQVPALKLQLSPSRVGDRQARRGLPVNETTEWRR